ncbi:MAG: phage major capsid protein [bacterium]|nr:phage major capsid protein [bacterium]MDY2830916.1 phage major capsid protein [Alphaproteobacteria bacterium]
MANQNYNDIFSITLESRTGKLADNISKKNALISRLKDKNKIRTVSGGSKILEELEYGEGDMVWYSGYDTIDYTPKQLFTAAEYAMKLAAVPVAVSGEDLLKNSGKEQVMELFEKRIQNAEKTMTNQLASAIYGDGTGSNGKAIGGLKLLVADDPTSGTVGNINRATTGNEFWRNQSLSKTALDSSTILAAMNELYLKCTRGVDKPDLIVTDDKLYAILEAAMQPAQRYTDPKLAEAGFSSLKFKGADVIYDGGQNGYCPENHMYFLNTDYLYLRPHKDRNMRVIGGDRLAVNQDAFYRIIGWAGNMTMSNAALQGVLINTPKTETSASGGNDTNSEGGN